VERIRRPIRLGGLPLVAGVGAYRRLTLTTPVLEAPHLSAQIDQNILRDVFSVSLL